MAFIGLPSELLLAAMTTLVHRRRLDFYRSTCLALLRQAACAFRSRMRRSRTSGKVAQAGHDQYACEYFAPYAGDGGVAQANEIVGIEFP